MAMSKCLCQQNWIECFCKTCGVLAYYLTRKAPENITEKEKSFECNECVYSRWQKEAKLKLF